MLELLKEERDGFSGVNHVFIAVALFCIILLFPAGVFSDFLQRMTHNGFILAVITFFVICGAALLPDCDNLPCDGGSAAVFSLGILGTFLSNIMVSISLIMTSIFHGKKDVTPYTQHRFFWHTFFVPIAIFLTAYFRIPDSNRTVMRGNSVTFQDIMPVLVPLIFIGICFYIGFLLLAKKTFKLVPFIRTSKTNMVAAILSGGTILYVMTLNYSDIKLLTYCIALGYAFHLVGDLFADGGIPALFPFTGIFGAFFKKIKLIPFTVKTGSTLESLLKIVFAVIDLILLYVLLRTRFHL